MMETDRTTGIHRRTLVTGAAWSVPAVMVASALPAYAVSLVKTTFFVTSIGATGLGYDLRTNSGPVLAGTTVSFRLTVTAYTGINTGSKSLTVTTTATTGTTDVTQTPVSPVTSDTVRAYDITITVTPGSLTSDLADIAATTIAVGFQQSVVGITVTNINLSAPSGGVEVDSANRIWP